MHDLGFEHIHPSEEERRELSETIWSADNVELTTVGVDVGSSTSHLMFARVHLQRLAEALSSRFIVVGREVLWQSPIRLTPYRADDAIDADALGAFVAGAYAEAGLAREDVDSGAVILTGEALKRRNARAIAELFSDQSGKFVCASAGHHMEASMAAHGSGAVALSKREHRAVLNIDIGGGTTKLALARDGRLIGTAAFAVGGRLVAFDDEGRLTRIEGPAERIAADAGVALAMGGIFPAESRRALAARMIDVIVEVATEGPRSALARALMVTEPLPAAPPPDVVTFSGGVSEYVYRRETAAHGDLGPALGHDIRHALADKRLPWPVYDPGQGIRATVIGASQFSVQVSGNTILVSDHASLPLRNVPVGHLGLDLSGEIEPEAVAQAVRATLTRLDLEDGRDRIALAFKWQGDPLHARLYALAAGIRAGLPKTAASDAPLILMMEGDVGRTLGEILRRELDVHGDIVSIDGVQLQDFDYVDIGALIEPTRVVPLVIKSLLFSAPGARA